MNEEEALFDANLTLTFPSENLDVAEAKLDDLLNYLEAEGFSVGAGSVSIEESEFADEFENLYEEDI